MIEALQEGGEWWRRRMVMVNEDVDAVATAQLGARSFDGSPLMPSRAARASRSVAIGECI